MDDVSFEVRAGEILGVAGVQGNGQTELCEALMGLRPPSPARCSSTATTSATTAPRERLRAGIGYIPEDRQEDGLVGDFSVADNLVLDVYDRQPFASGIALNLDAIRENAVRRVEEFDVRTSSVATPTRTLSGGNQQKVDRGPRDGPGPQACCWPASRPAAWTSGRSSSCTAASSSSGTRAWPWSSCPPSSTRSTRSPTGSRSCTRARSSASGRPTVSAEELGLLMAGAGATARTRGAADGPEAPAGPRSGRGTTGGQEPGSDRSAGAGGAGSAGPGGPP